MSAAQESWKHIVREIEKRGATRRPRTIEGPQGTRAQIDGKTVVNLSSNNYLGLAQDQRVKTAAKAAIDCYGCGSCSARSIMTTKVHAELEDALARFKRTDSSIVFNTGFSANVGALQTLLSEHDLIFSDSLNHGSIIDGCRLSGARTVVYPHKDVQALEALLQEQRTENVRLIVTDGVFSMDGDVAPLPEIARLAKSYGCVLMVDDAHGTGVMGTGGRGTVDFFDLRNQVQVQMGTLSKAFGSVGGYIAGDRDMVELIRNQARPYLLSTALPPGDMAAAITSLRILEQEPMLLQRLWENTSYFRDGLAQLGFDTGESVTPIIPVHVGEEKKANSFADSLFSHGVYALSIAYPLVQAGKARIRTIVTATHDKADLDTALDAFAKCGRKCGAI